MSDEPIHILSTGAIPGFQMPPASSGKLRVDIIPSHHIEFVSNENTISRIRAISQTSAVVVFTSVNAVEAVVRQLNGHQPAWKIYCIGNVTKDKVLESFTTVSLGESASNAGDLADLIIRDQIDALVFFCGDLRRNELPQKLKEKNIQSEELIVYKTVYTPVALVKPYKGILFFSPGAVESYFQMNSPSDEMVFFAIGKTTESAIRSYCSNLILTGDHPGKMELAQKALKYFEEKISK